MDREMDGWLERASEQEEEQEPFVWWAQMKESNVLSCRLLSRVVLYDGRVLCSVLTAIALFLEVTDFIAMGGFLITMIEGDFYGVDFNGLAGVTGNGYWCLGAVIRKKVEETILELQLIG